MTGYELRTVLSMSLGNLGRHRVKTIITVTAVLVSVSLYIAMDAWILGMNIDSKRNIVNYESGAVKIQTKAYFDNKDELPMYESFAGADLAIHALETQGYRAAPRFVFSGTLHSRIGTAPIVFTAVDPALEASVLRYPLFIDSGSWLESGTRGLVLGMMAADKLRVGIPQKTTRRIFEEDILSAARNEEEHNFIASLYRESDSLSLARRPFEQAAPEGAERMVVLDQKAGKAERDRLWALLAASGRMDVRISTTIDMRDEQGKIRHVNQLIDAVVVGVVNSPNPQTNGSVGFMALDSLQDETGLMLGGAATEIVVRSADADDSKLPGPADREDAVRSALERGLAEAGTPLSADLTVRNWEAFAQDFIAASAGDNVSTRIMAVFLFVLSFIGIANTMLMAVLERTKEIGMLRALGMTDGQLVLCYMIEAGLIGFIGSAAGVALGAAINIPMVAYGIDYSAMTEAMNGDIGYRVAAYFRSAWNVPTMIGTACVATLASAAMAVPPTLHALSMPVTDSLRFE